MRLRVMQPFTDMITRSKYAVGDVIEISEAERIENIITNGLGVEYKDKEVEEPKAEEEATSEAPKGKKRNTRKKTTIEND